MASSVTLTLALAVTYGWVWGESREYASVRRAVARAMKAIAVVRGHVRERDLRDAAVRDPGGTLPVDGDLVRADPGGHVADRLHATADDFFAIQDRRIGAAIGLRVHPAADLARTHF